MIPSVHVKSIARGGPNIPINGVERAAPPEWCQQFLRPAFVTSQVKCSCKSLCTIQPPGLAVVCWVGRNEIWHCADKARSGFIGNEIRVNKTHINVRGETRFSKTEPRTGVPKSTRRRQGPRYRLCLCPLATEPELHWVYTTTCVIEGSQDTEIENKRENDTPESRADAQLSYQVLAS